MPHRFPLVVDAYDNRPLVPVGKFRFLINPLTEQVPAASAELLRQATDWILEAGAFEEANKIIGEEDKGAILVASTSLATGLPFGMARWLPSGQEGQIAVDFVMEYASGRLYLNGVEPNDRLFLVDDMISTGGTMLALIEAVHRAGADLADVVCVAEKVEYGGVARIAAETGVRVKTLLKVSVAGERSRVIDA